jgi:hypothetical protein
MKKGYGSIIESDEKMTPRKKYKELYQNSLSDLKYWQMQLEIAKRALLKIENIMNAEIKDGYKFAITPRIASDCWHSYSEICICFITNRVTEVVINRMNK